MHERKTVVAISVWYEFVKINSHGKFIQTPAEFGWQRKEQKLN